jgi:hypothetical protein
MLSGGRGPLVRDAPGSGAGPVAGPGHEQLVAVVDQSVEQGLGDDRVGEQRIPVDRGAVGGQDQRPAGAFVDQLVEVVGLGRGQLAHGEVVQDEHGGAGEFTQPAGPAAIGVATGQLGQDPAGLGEAGLGPGPDRLVGEGLGDVGLPDPDRYPRFDLESVVFPLVVMVLRSMWRGLRVLLVVRSSLVG